MEKPCLFLFRYKDGMVAFAGAIFRQVQYQYNFSQLDDLDNSTSDDNVSRCLLSDGLVVYDVMS